MSDNGECFTNDGGCVGPANLLFRQLDGDLEDALALLRSSIEGLDESSKIEAINRAKVTLHKLSPFAGEPVDCVLWVPVDSVTANDYNPNAVAPPEMKLLEHSIAEDGYTQPIVTWRNANVHEVVDGFHRNRVGKESLAVRQRIRGYLPIVSINPDRQGRGDRIAATIRHNRARGKHKIDSMSEIVVELKRRNWGNDKIGRELGMEPDEVLRLCQITGLSEMFSDQSFSKAWDVEGHVSESDFIELTDDPTDDDCDVRTVNTSDDSRVFHTYDKWECYKAGFYATTKDGMTADECKGAYREFLSDIPRFSAALKSVTEEWVHSCEHYLTNSAMNRIAWLGQAAACYALGIPAMYRGGFSFLTEAQQEAANAEALKYLNSWLKRHGLEEVTLDAALSQRQADIY